MGNSLPLPCVCRRCCHDEVNEVDAGTAAVAGGAKKRRRKQQQRRPDRSRNVWAARPRHVVVPVVDAPEDGDDVRREQEAWPECHVEPAGHGEDGAVRVRIVMKRRDIAQLVARLEQRGAEERNAAAGIEEVISTDLAGCSGGGGVTIMSPSRDAWRPRLSVIPEN
ncbi:hypothetical protein BDA96_09G238400 [Sorghum bicolor]|uniref:Uncharacterized protein n=1 Tax=Sorghum bicolor TaxID=4558 RepID=A0A921QDM1_SORBI|nr:hypothetical protein BDA96_09G238400 [Sorghum bicolor]